jgi:hypothetical protein
LLLRGRFVGGRSLGALTFPLVNGLRLGLFGGRLVARLGLFLCFPILLMVVVGGVATFMMRFRFWIALGWVDGRGVCGKSLLDRGQVVSSGIIVRHSVLGGREGDLKVSVIIRALFWDVRVQGGRRVGRGVRTRYI